MLSSREKERVRERVKSFNTNRSSNSKANENHFANEEKKKKARKNCEKFLVVVEGEQKKIHARKIFDYRNLIACEFSHIFSERREFFLFLGHLMIVMMNCKVESYHRHHH